MVVAVDSAVAGVESRWQKAAQAATVEMGVKVGAGEAGKVVEAAEAVVVEGAAAPRESGPWDPCVPAGHWT